MPQVMLPVGATGEFLDYRHAIPLLQAVASLVQSPREPADPASAGTTIIGEVRHGEVGPVSAP